MNTLHSSTFQLTPQIIIPGRTPVASVHFPDFPLPPSVPVTPCADGHITYSNFTKDVKGILDYSLYASVTSIKNLLFLHKGYWFSKPYSTN